jgi:hypothetical protein
LVPYVLVPMICNLDGAFFQEHLRDHFLCLPELLAIGYLFLVMELNRSWGVLGHLPGLTHGLPKLYIDPKLSALEHAIR